jgi:hypothetical protein
MAGCDKDEIRRYQVPRLETARRETAHKHGPARIWFVKVVGPSDEIASHKEAFDRFIRSVHFEAGKIGWTVPDGWQEQPGSQMRYGTFRIGPADKALDLSVVVLDNHGDAASVLANVNRWRGQLGLQPVAQTGLAEIATPLDLDGVTATLVDMSSAGDKPQRMLAAIIPQGDDAGHLHYDVPEGWAVQADPSGMSEAAFQVSDGQHVAKITVVPLPGPAGGLVQNVNRWRGQIGLEPVSEEQLRSELSAIEVGGRPAQYVNLIGPESSGTPRQRVLGVIASRGEQTWFFKMTGPADFVEKQKTAFETFVSSVKF